MARQTDGFLKLKNDIPFEGPRGIGSPAVKVFDRDLILIGMFSLFISILAENI